MQYGWNSVPMEGPPGYGPRGGGYAQRGAARPAGVGGLSLEPAPVLTAEGFMALKTKRQKVLPPGAVKRNSGYKLWALGKPYRFYCSVKGKWTVADQVAFDERLNTFQSVEQYSKAVRPKGGLGAQKVNYWPQLGVGETQFKAIADKSSSAFTVQYTAQDRAEFEPAPQPPTEPDVSGPQSSAPSTVPAPAPAPARTMPPPPMMRQPMMPPPMDMFHPTHDDDAQSMFKADATTIADEESERMSAVPSMYEAGEGATEAGSTIDYREIQERERVSDARVEHIATLAKVERHRAESGLNEYDMMEAVPRRGSHEFSAWMTEFNAKHGFKPDILIKAYPK